MDVAVTEDDLWGTVFTSLDALSKVFIGETGVSHVYDLEKYFVI